jgi:rod shape determining protein RodA
VGLLLGLPMFLVLQEPDLGHTLMLLFIGGTMLAFEKFERRALVTAVLVFLVAAPFLWKFVLRDYQKDRILTLVDSDADALGAGWHARQARVAVGSGGLLGKGHGDGTQVAGGFLPENHTDFVFANLAEEQGFLGAAVVLGLYLLLVMCALRSAAMARDKFGGHVAVGVAALVFWGVLMNMGMVLNMLPVTGVTLPLMSYGGTSVLTVMSAIGLLLNINLRRTVF